MSEYDESPEYDDGDWRFEPKNWSDDATLGEVREFIRENWGGKGASCPACTRRVAIAEHGPNRAIVEALALVWDNVDVDEPFHLVNKVHQLVSEAGWARPGRGNDVAGMRYLKLIQRVKSKDELNAIRNPHERLVTKAYYRVTPLLGQWLRGEVSIPKGFYTFDGKFLGLTEGEITVHEAYTSEFSLDAIINESRPETGDNK